VGDARVSVILIGRGLSRINADAKTQKFSAYIRVQICDALEHMNPIPLDAGFSLALDHKQLLFGDDVVIAETKTRTRGELAAFALDASTCAPADAIQYWMYNGVAARADSLRLQNCGAQYELTWILPNPLGAERAKTLGHIHNAPSQNGATFPEIYEVLYGSAFFCFYRLDETKTRALFCGYVSARAGEQIVMPPNTYHLTINAGDTPLLFADVISKQARGLYDDVRATRGAPYYALRDGTWQRNSMFADAASLADCPQLRVESVTPLYENFTHQPDAFDWLNEPALFWDKFSSVSNLTQYITD
jgi:glucose-6-phosphate isomerase